MFSLVRSITTVVCLMIVMMNSATISANTEQTTHAAYGEAELVKARIAWAGQENRLGQLIFEADAKKLAYFCGNYYVAQIDDNNKMITTWIEDGKCVTLSYSDFKRLLNDSKIIELANKRLQQSAQN